MKKIFFLSFLFGFLFAENVVCVKKVESVGYVSKYYKICIEGKSFVSLFFDTKFSIMGYTGDKCKCVKKTKKGLFGESVYYEYQDIGKDKK